MSVYRYSKYKIRIDPDSQKTQGLQAGDIVRRQYAERERTVYSLMCVTETGTELVGDKDSPYFIGALLDGDEPQNGELLDFVRVTSLFDSTRSGALFLTASDDEAPYMDVIDGMAREHSLCYPEMAGGIMDVPDKSKYTVSGDCLATDYMAADNGVSRIVRLTRTAQVLDDTPFGLKQTLEENVGHPERLLVSFKIRASGEHPGVPLSFGYTNGEKYDAEDTVAVSGLWEYKLWVLTVEYPRQYARSFRMDLSGLLTAEGDWCEVGDLNIIRLSSLATCAESTKARIGKVSGIIDPVFGVLDGYGAYFQNLYATRNVNIAGTLTAGDENGFSSTFYVGKIHKNVIPDSLSCAFTGSLAVAAATPAGIGRCVQVAADSRLAVQRADWRKARIGNHYCFSVWIKSEEAGTARLYQDEHLIGEISIPNNGEWRRYKMVFPVRDSDAPDMTLGIASSVPLLLTAPQLEAGRTATPYQATDEVLSYTEDYGAWFSKGGIGGTIQHPLLRLNEDGSIASRDGSFVINPDGTGHFASGRFKWTKDTIELRDVTIRWEDLDEEMKEQIKPRSVSLTGGTAFRFTDELSGTCEPERIPLVATEYNFEPEGRLWEYLASDGAWKDAGCNGAVFEMTPSFHGWEGRDVLTLRYSAIFHDEKIGSTHTFFKLYDGAPSYTVYVESENGTTFRNGIVSTVLRARVYRGGEEITPLIPDGNFRWIRTSRDTEGDEAWNDMPRYGKAIEITGEDVRHKAVFGCEVNISITEQ
ncbi:hypothetical protein [Bacteroides uniformis]|uniref:hypothetical protein n=1 Tax=Bacteroides uniformis TaxID=820 RepID=UPI00189A50DD|nr:hypothetical protein [Bacteroides uniformis]MDC1998214.1 hypothetical protein [Bacteroides uniformis]MDC2001978.1 hypothetical protein [Bacteroides uniformis]MDC2005699.1 hypothetical protein [Bacteroides uniformis]